MALLSAMLHELLAPGVGTRSFVSAAMKQIIILLARSKRDGPVGLFQAVTEPHLGAAVAAVMQRPKDSHTIESMAEEAGMSRSRFCHHFAIAYRCTPRSFVQSVRLASAAKMLSSSELPVKAIAASVGYASRSHFSRAFNAKYGIDPSSYRRERECA
jgi:transcriptional regulator GlxA family with amidase domain